MSKLAILGGPKVLPNGTGAKWPIFDKTDENALLKTFRTGKWWRGGTIKEMRESMCGQFERAYADWQGSADALTCCNGTIAIEMALRAAGVKAGDEVIVPALSFVVSASAVLPMGAVAVFADCDPDTYQPDAASIEAAITPRTAAIIIVHFGGYPADMDRITKIARKHNLPLIEDCAHAQGSQWRGKGVGTFGQFGTFSFQQSKAITSGEGGIVVCGNREDWLKLYRYHHLGRREDKGFYDFYEVSSNYRLTDLQGSILLSQLPKLKKQTPQKMAGAKHLGNLLKKIGGIEPLPEDKRITRRGYYFFLMRYNKEEWKGLHREDFLRAVNAEGMGGVGMGRAYGRPIYKYPLFQDLKVPAKYARSQYKKVCCPATERAMEGEVVSLSHQYLLAPKATLAKIAEAVAKVKDNVDALLAAKKAGRLKDE
jgi:dTDP-4-amino-4,6-dideoxygalactose transaminase